MSPERKGPIAPATLAGCPPRSGCCPSHRRRRLWVKATMRRPSASCPCPPRSRWGAGLRMHSHGTATLRRSGGADPTSRVPLPDTLAPRGSSPRDGRAASSTSRPVCSRHCWTPGVSAGSPRCHGADSPLLSWKGVCCSGDRAAVTGATGIRFPRVLEGGSLRPDVGRVGSSRVPRGTAGRSPWRGQRSLESVARAPPPSTLQSPPVSSHGRPSGGRVRSPVCIRTRLPRGDSPPSRACLSSPAL